MEMSSILGTEYWGRKTTGDVLYEALEKLTEHELKQFKDVLACLPTRVPIQPERLQKADFLGTKYILLDVFGEEAALDVLIRVFRLIGLTERAEDYQHEAISIVKTQKLYLSKALEGCREKYMEEMRQSYYAIKHHDKRIGEDFNLKRKYTSIVLEKKLHKITAAGQRHRRTMAKGSSDEYSPTTIQDLFSPDDVGIIHNTVVLQGTAGMGKTMACQRLMLDWASGDLYKDQFNFVFFISCEEINTFKSEISLSKYLSRCCWLSGPYCLLRSIFMNSEGILVILDGFDEVNLSSMKNTEVCEDPFQEVSKDILLNSLFRRTLLRDCCQIITTRPFSSMKLTDLVYSPQYVEIRGFTKNQREEYVYKFFNARDQADLVFNMIKDNDTLFDMCYLPLSAWILCTVMKQFLKLRLRLLDSMPFTSIYLWYLKALIKYHGRTYDQPLEICLKKLCSLAIEGVWNGRNVFEESDLARHGVTISVFESVILKDTISQRGTEPSICYSFIPFGIQEVFAALYYVLDEKQIKFGNWKMKDLLEASEDRPHLKSTVRHLFGVSSEKQIQEAERTVGYPVAFREEPELEQWVMRHPSDYHNEVLCCLYEAKAKDCVQRIMSHSQNLKLEGFHGKNKDQATITCRALAYCLENSSVRHTVFFKDYILGPIYRNVLSKALSRCSELRFEGCKFPKKEKAPYWEEYSVPEFFKEDQMRKLTLQRCGLTSSSCDDLRSVLITCPYLMTLDLSENNLGDIGIKLLCEGLRHRDCYLRVLRLQACGLTSSCCDYLRSIITTHRFLITLDLSRNNLRDSGVKVLCGLGCQPSTLQELMLQDCNLTSSCCDDLCSVLTTNRSLMTLDLSDNHLQDAGVKLLCDGLRHPACTLQELRLQMCGLTSSCCEDLHSVISKHQSLTTLDLTRNNLQDRGVKLLCEGLGHPDCTLKELWLWRCQLTSSCYDDLHSVLTTNRSLIILDLRGNNLQHCGERLRQVAKQPLQLLVSTCAFRKWRLDKIAEQPI
ncbi:NACHT, LRR and PYD domains-containing protein 3-like [Pseudophryne corroboree]|uniref:NACHT, LRR and PYD domains-containing protein 3-like n=1 Tax=Pseudophryne corroboree TaxID=495146 RepID=UPI00308139CE